MKSANRVELSLSGSRSRSKRSRRTHTVSHKSSSSSTSHYYGYRWPKWRRDISNTSKSEAEEIETRTLHIRDPESAHLFPDNTVSTAKYSFLNFLPKNLWEQFRRIANIYFLLISILQVSTDLSPTNRFATVLPLTIVILVTMVKELLEDMKRHAADRVINKSLVHVYREGEELHVFEEKESVERSNGEGDFVDIPRYQVCVGDIVMVQSLSDSFFSSFSFNSFASLPVFSSVSSFSLSTSFSVALFMIYSPSHHIVLFLFQVKNGELIPADITIIHSTGPQGLCYVETSNLDG